MSRRLTKEIIDRARAIAEERQPEAVRANLEAGQPIVDEIVEAGLEIGELGDLRLVYPRNKRKYRQIVPILIHWLSRMENIDVRCEIVGALAVPVARPLAIRPLIEAFEAENCDDRRGFYTKSAIAFALSVVASDSVFDEIVLLIRDKRHGQCRQNLVRALANMKNPRAVQVLLEILDSREPLIASQALRPLGRLRAKEARDHIRPFLTHEDPWVRNEAKRALQKIDKGNR